MQKRQHKMSVNWQKRVDISLQQLARQEVKTISLQVLYIQIENPINPPYAFECVLEAPL